VPVLGTACLGRRSLVCMLRSSRRRLLELGPGTARCDRSQDSGPADAARVPDELAALDARIARLRERLKNGDADLAPDELEIAIAGALGKRQELTQGAPARNEGARILALLPGAADEFRREIERARRGESAAALKARVTLRKLLGDIRLEPGEEEGSLYATFEGHPAALIQAAVTSGRGDRI
jgi:hypothetical protein